MIPSLNEAFDDDNPDAAHLRHYSYVSSNIERLKEELDRHDEERRKLFDHMKNSEDFQNRMQPVLNDYRRRTRQGSSYPQTSQPTGKKLRRPSTPYRPLPPPPSNSSGKGSSRSARSFLSAGNSSDNPIDVDNFKTVKKPRFDPQIFEIRNEYRRSTSNKGKTVEKPMTDEWCERCHQQGHHHTECETKTFKPPCKRCGQTGHVKDDCDTKIRSFTHCDTCEWLGRPQTLCGHYDVSPVDVRVLRGGRIPYDYSN
jgi:Zinc knuckle